MADRVVGRRQLMRKCTVCLQVILIHYIDAQLIRQLKKKRIRRIVGCADRINIENLAQQNIPLYLIRRHGVAVRRARVVMIHAVELDLASVDKENIAPDLDRLESDSLPDARCLRLIINVIEGRLFSIPFDDIKIIKCNDRHSVFRGNSPRQIDSVALDNKCDIRIRECLSCHFQRISIPVLICHSSDIPEICRFRYSEQNISEDTVVAEHVLTLKIRSGAPASYNCDELIFTGCQFSGQVELGGIMRALGVTDKFTVQIEVDAACDTQKRNNILLIRVIDRQLPAINADEVVLFSRILIAQRKRLIDTDP